jgi:hypothetical protein
MTLEIIQNTENMTLKDVMQFVMAYRLNHVGLDPSSFPFYSQDSFIIKGIKITEDYKEFNFLI